MKLKFREKVKLFWDRNGADIIGWLVGAGAMTGIGCVGAHLVKKQIEKEEAEKEMIRKELEAQREKAAQELREAAARDAADPANQLTGGGYVLPDNDGLYETDAPNILANCVPLSSMGEFGQDVINRLCNEYPNWKQEGYFNPETAVADIWVDFGHEVWKLRNSEEAEDSQKKQAS